ncbi:MAG: hypothetical protein AB1585_21800, partial [Thermodesulfobacteriota bacterium]
RVKPNLLGKVSPCIDCTMVIYLPTCFPRLLDWVAALLGRRGEARNHYHEAIRVCTEMRSCRS